MFHSLQERFLKYCTRSSFALSGLNIYSTPTRGNRIKTAVCGRCWRLGEQMLTIIPVEINNFIYFKIKNYYKIFNFYLHILVSSFTRVRNLLFLNCENWLDLHPWLQSFSNFATQYIQYQHCSSYFLVS